MSRRKHLSITFNERKQASRELFELLSLKNSVAQGKCETFTNWKSKRRYRQTNFGEVLCAFAISSPVMLLWR